MVVSFVGNRMAKTSWPQHCLLGFSSSHQSSLGVLGVRMILLASSYMNEHPDLLLHAQLLNLYMLAVVRLGSYSHAVSRTSPNVWNACGHCTPFCSGAVGITGALDVLPPAGFLGSIKVNWHKKESCTIGEPCRGAVDALAHLQGALEQAAASNGGTCSTATSRVELQQQQHSPLMRLHSLSSNVKLGPALLAALPTAHLAHLDLEFCLYKYATLGTALSSR